MSGYRELMKAAKAGRLKNPRFAYEATWIDPDALKFDLGNLVVTIYPRHNVSVHVSSSANYRDSKCIVFSRRKVNRLLRVLERQHGPLPTRRPADWAVRIAEASARAAS